MGPTERFRDRGDPIATNRAARSGGGRDECVPFVRQPVAAARGAVGLESVDDRFANGLLADSVDELDDHSRSEHRASQRVVVGELEGP